MEPVSGMERSDIRPSEHWHSASRRTLPSPQLNYGLLVLEFCFLLFFNSLLPFCSLCRESERGRCRCDRVIYNSVWKTRSINKAGRRQLSLPMPDYLLVFDRPQPLGSTRQLNFLITFPSTCISRIWNVPLQWRHPYILIGIRNQPIMNFRLWAIDS